MKDSSNAILPGQVNARITDNHRHMEGYPVDDTPENLKKNPEQDLGQDKENMVSGDTVTKEDTTDPSGEFAKFINRMCAAFNWKTREFDNEHAVIEFTVDQLRSQTLFIFCYDDDLEFSVPSFAAFDSMEKVPHYISTSLMQINAKSKIGFWCVELIGEKLVYTYMHNARMSLTDEAAFKDIITTLIQRVDDFENLLVKMSEQGKTGEEPIQQ